MSKSRSILPYLIDDDSDGDIDLFCHLEKMLQNSESKLSQDFSTHSILGEQKTGNNELTNDEIIKFREAFYELKSKVVYINRKKEEIDRNLEWINQERKELEKERRKIEKDKIVIESKLENTELITLRKEFKELKIKYETERMQWVEEKNKLLAQIKSDGSKSHQARNPLHPNYDLNLDFKPGKIIKTEHREDGKNILTYENGYKATEFRNGNIKMKHNRSLYTFYSNGDVSQKFKDGACGYLYSSTGTIELSLPNMDTRYIFSNGQREEHFSDGRKIIFYPNGELKRIYPNGNYEIHYPTGKVEKFINGVLHITYSKSEQ